MLSVLAALMLASPDAGAFTGTLDKELIRRAVHAQWPEVRRCFEQPNATSGKLVVRFVIGADGRVTESELAQPTTFPKPIVECVLSEVRRVKTAPPLGGSVVVTYPFFIDTIGF
ncbi:MAG: AgmX/PglI C-terminal domain-containing protein [Myxococcaceae bacterium]